MARYTGKDGSASIGGVAWKLTNWDFEVTSKSVEVPAAGDPWTERVHLRGDWRATVQGVMDVTTVATYMPAAIGSTAAIVLVPVAGGSISDTGIVTSAKYSSPIDGPITVEATIESSDGSAGPVLV